MNHSILFVKKFHTLTRSFLPPLPVISTGHAPYPIPSSPPLPSCSHRYITTSSLKYFTYLATIPPKDVKSRDIIQLHGIELFAYHGVYEAERKLGQKFIIDLDIYTDVQDAAMSDLLHDTIDYHLLYNGIKSMIITGKQYQLLESLAQHIALYILNQYRTIGQCVVRVKKPHVAIDTHVDYTAVTVTRTQDDSHLYQKRIMEAEEEGDEDDRDDYAGGSTGTVTGMSDIDEHSAYQASDISSKQRRVPRTDTYQAESDLDEADKFMQVIQQSREAANNEKIQERLQSLKEDRLDNENIELNVTGRDKRLRHTTNNGNNKANQPPKT